MAAATGAHPDLELLTASVRGNLQNPQALTVQQHLATCAECRRATEEMTAANVGGRPAVEPGASPSKPNDCNTFDFDADVHSQPRSSAVPNAIPAPLASLPQYRIEKRLGGGGMGTVFLAENILLARKEVLKVIHEAALLHRVSKDRFLREMRAAASLHHPNIVTAYSAVSVGGMLVFTMQYIPGEDLSQLVRTRGPLPVANACFYARQAALGLQHSHERGMIHRDVKPSNLILERQGQKHIVRILDFGLARVNNEHGRGSKLTGVGRMLGTPDFCAPEQALDAARADIRADVYGLGCTIYFLLAGKTPFCGGSALEVMLAHQSMEAEPLDCVRADVPPALAAVVRKMMAKDPGKRYQSSADVAAALNQFLKPERARTAESASPPSRVRADGAAGSPFGDQQSPRESAASPNVDHVSSSSQVTERETRPETTSHRAGVPHSMKPRMAIAGVFLSAVLGSAGVIFTLLTREGAIIVHVTQKEPEIQVDDKMVQVIWANGGKSATIKLKPGIHDLHVTKRGFVSEGRRVVLSAGGVQEMYIEFVPARDIAVAPSMLTSPFDQVVARESQRSWATHLKTTHVCQNKFGMKMLLIPPGEFLMGGDEPAEGVLRFAKETDWKDADLELFKWEHPQRRVTITKPFWVAQTEVTIGQFRRFVESAAYQTEAEKDGRGGYGYNVEQKRSDGPKTLYTWKNTGWEQSDDHPVVNVSWNDATAFCLWLCREEHAEYRLLTEAEWEYACRAGTTSRYFTGHNPNSLKGFANVGGWPAFNFDDGENFTARVGKYQPNSFGLNDMTGNAWEWCSDYGPYDPAQRKDPIGQSNGDERLFRGGSWDSGPASCRSASRSGGASSVRNNYLGFRVARSSVRD